MRDRNTDADWEQIAETDPYWGVLSLEKYKGHAELDGPIADEFFASGEHYIQGTLQLLKNHFGGYVAPRRALDFGCGVGRVLIPLARVAGNVCGVDISSKMLDLCRANLTRAGIANAELVLGDDALSRLQGNFDFINSILVFQHIPPSRGYQLLSTLLSRLEPGGCASLQLTYGRSRRFLQNDLKRGGFIRRVGDDVVDLGPPREPPPHGTITMYDYDLNRVHALLSQVGARVILSVPTSDDDHLGVQLVFQKSRPGN